MYPHPMRVSHNMAQTKHIFMNIKILNQFLVALTQEKIKQINKIYFINKYYNFLDFYQNFYINNFKI